MMTELFESLVQKLPERWFRDEIIWWFCEVIGWLLFIVLVITAGFGLLFLTRMFK